MEPHRRDSMMVEPAGLAKDDEIKAWTLDHYELDMAAADEEDDEGGNDKTRKAFINAAKGWKGIVQTNEDYHEFAEEHYSAVKTHIKADEKSGYRQGTLLHSLVSSMEDIKLWKLWAKLILDIAKIEKIPILTRTHRTEGFTCLHRAIQDNDIDFVNRVAFVTFICSISDKQEARDAIAATNKRDQTCIHLAIAEIEKVSQSSFGLVDYLVQNSDPQVFNMKRGKIEELDMGAGNTCLHDLVHIRLCKSLERKCRKEACITCDKRNSQYDSDGYANDYLRILNTMAEKCPEAMITMNDAEQSAFLFHRHTRSRTKETKAWGRLELSTADVGDAIANTAPANMITKDKIKDKPLPTGKEEASMKTKQGAAAGKEDASVKPQTKQSAATGKDEAASKPQLAKQKHIKATSEYSQQLATDVSRLLMGLCLSLKTFPTICESLFGQEYPSYELMFKAAPLTEKTTDIHASLSLDPILACVELGLNDTASSMSSQSNARRGEEKAREARENLVTDFFDWLRDTRHVKRIIKLVVSDHPRMPCRDDVIREALKGFDIRHLDWDKEDLCMQSLAKDDIAPNLQELWLSWSGRNSTLLGWSNAEDGLWTLKKLETVYVSTGTEWESASTNHTNLSQFRNRLAAKGDKRGIAVNAADDNDSKPVYNTDFSVREGALKQGNHWLKAVQVFCDALTKKVPRNQRDKIKGQVKVAIIDDGVDLGDLQAPQYVGGGWHPDKKAPDRRTMNAWYYSEKKHGTEMAKLIQLVCPFVSLYVAKLDTRRLVYTSVAESAAKAIRAAVAHGASVISMSWTIYQSADNKDGIGELEQAIREAGMEAEGANGERYNTLMFCASEDSGFTSFREPYPATRCDTRIIKRVGSAGVYGERSEYVDPKTIDYLFPGEIVSSRDVCSGSSASTALAAGLSALVLWCAALTAQTSPPIAEARTPVGAPPRRADSMFPNGGMRAAGTGIPSQKINFQTHERMYGLFDALKSSMDNPFVNIIRILHDAAAADDPPAKLIELCKSKIPDLFK
ncbi:hypothetical protein ABW21_db0201646 [Orbilia brochopaga]|nr:hypothetical protein ABW21_db0201646 [Drechslerella brochopaga]